MIEEAGWCIAERRTFINNSSKLHHCGIAAFKSKTGRVWCRRCREDAPESLVKVEDKAWFIEALQRLPSLD